MEEVAVVGAGNFGTAIAQILALNSKKVILYSRREEIAHEIEKNRHNSEYYPNIQLHDNIIPTSNIKDIKNSEIVFLSIPSSAIRETVKLLSNILEKGTILVNTAKGIEYPSLNTMGTIINEYFGEDYVVLSGPNFASEIVYNLPTISNIASKNPKSSEIVKNILTTDNFGIEILDDPVGVELTGIIKNINAIAYGICQGMNINENGLYAVLTRGFNETKEIISTLGGKLDTVDSYCGFGDLVLTSTSNKSRNHTLGVLHGQRIIVDEKSSGIVVEGKNSIKAIKTLCDSNSIDSLIVNFVFEVIIENQNPEIAFSNLWKKLIK